MPKKKILILALLWIAAAASIFYGIKTPPSGNRPVAQAAHGRDMIMIETTAEEIISARRLAKRAAYDSWGRSPFVSTETPAEEVVTLTLNGIVYDERKPIAIINNVMVAVGYEIEGNTVVNIEPQRVTLNDGEKDFRLTLTEE